MGQTYEPIVPTTSGWLWSETLTLYLGIYNQQLRYFNSEGELVLSPQEAAEQAQQQANRAQQQAERLVAQLRSLGIEPEEIQNFAGAS